MTLASFAAQLLASFYSFAETAAPLAITALWQGIAISAALALCFRLTPRMTAAYRFALWFAAFCVLVALPFVPRLFAPESTGIAVSSLPHAASSGPLLHLGTRWSMVIAGLWLLASLLRAADLITHSFRLRKLWRTAVSVPVPIPEAVAFPARGFALCTTTHLDRPSVIGFFAPRILIPDWLYSRLTAGELRQIVLHESEHLRRRDDWTNLLQKLCLVLFPLNPGLLWIDRRLAKEREMACDEGVIRITQAPRAYAACLASLAERGLHRRTAAALSLGAWHRRPELALRVHSLLRTQRNLHPVAARSLITVFSAALLVAAFELARCPQLVAFTPAQSPALAASLVNAQPPHLVGAAVTFAPCRSRLVSPYHAVAAVAHMPAAPSRMRAVVQPQPQHSSIRAVPTLAHLDPPQQRIVRTTTLQATDPSTGAQYIVYTEFEQIQTAGERTPLTADYDTPRSGDAPPAQKSDVQAQPSTHTTITRMIFRVVPATSQSSQPTAIPIGNGWFVFQL